MPRANPKINVRACGLCVLLLTTGLGCGGAPASPGPPAQWVATDGQVSTPRYDPSRFAFEGGDPKILPLRTSGAHDLRCPIAEVTARSLHSGRAETYVAEGCNQRAVYLIVRRQTPSEIYDCVLTGIVPLAPPSGP
jgi:hypothetical protein